MITTEKKHESITERHRRLWQYHAGILLLCIMGIAFTCASFAYGFAAQRADICFASIAGFATCAIIGWLEAGEAAKCRRIARNWDRYDRRDLQANLNTRL